jgi:hypothetical protein
LGLYNFHNGDKIDEPVPGGTEAETGGFLNVGEETDDDLQIIPGKQSQDYASGHSEYDSDFDSDSDEKDGLTEIDRAKVSEVHERIVQQIDAGKLSLQTDSEKEAFYATYDLDYITGR